MVLALRAGVGERKANKGSLSHRDAVHTDKEEGGGRRGGDTIVIPLVPLARSFKSPQTM